MDRFGQRQGFLLSATVHLILMTLLTGRDRWTQGRKPGPEPSASPSRMARVMLPPPEVLRQVLPPPSRPPQAQAHPVPPPVPTPPPASAKDRISIGSPSTERAKQLVLRREDDLTKTPKGTPNAVPSPPASTTPPEPAEKRTAERAGSSAVPGSEGLRLPPGIGELARGEEGQRPGPGARGS